MKRHLNYILIHWYERFPLAKLIRSDTSDSSLEPLTLNCVHYPFSIVLRELSMALTKADLAEDLFENVGLSKRDAKDTVEVFFEEIRKALENGEQVKLSGFGNFDLRDKNERPGRNPKTGEDIPISARRVVTFRPGQKLKARVESIEIEK